MLHGCQQCRGKAFGLLALALDGNDLGQDGKSDFLRRLAANGKTDGCMEGINAGLGQPHFSQLGAHQRTTTLTAHHANIGGGLLQDGAQADHIIAVGTGNHYKIALLSAGNPRKTLLKRLTEYGIRPGAAQIIGILGTIFQRSDRHPQQLCQLDHRHAHMAAAADNELRGRTEALHKDTLPCQFNGSACGHSLQHGPVLCPEGGQRLRPDRRTAPEKNICPLCRAIYDSGQQKIPCRVIQCIEKRTVSHPILLFVYCSTVATAS